jgi:hypothetical protein
VKSVDAKTGAVTEYTVNWPAVNASRYAAEGAFAVKNVEADGTTTALSGPYWNGDLRVNYPIAGTMREVTAYITVTEVPDYKLVLGSEPGSAMATFSNNSGEPVKGRLLIAIYDSGRLVKIFSKEFNLVSDGEASLTAAIPDVYDGMTIKAFAWDSDYIPLTVSAEGKA